MPIYKPALARLREAKLTGPTCAAMLEAIAVKMAESGASTAEFRLGYIEDNIAPENLPKEGELIPEIILRLTQV